MERRAIRSATPCLLNRFGRHIVSCLAILLAIVICGCERYHETPVSSDHSEIEVWMHASTEEEGKTFQDQVAHFNAAQYEVRVNAVILPANSYDVQVREAAGSGTLPDMLEFDGPFVYEFIDRGLLIPIDKLLTDEARLDLLPSVISQGMYDGRIYAIGTTESALGIYARRSELLHAGVRIPASPQDAWSPREFNEALERLARADADGAVLDLKLNRDGRWLVDAVMPLIQSVGANLVNRDHQITIQGTLNGEEVVTALQFLQDWKRRGFIEKDRDDDAFVSGRVALSWGTGADYPHYAAAWGDDLVVLPLPNFGSGSRTTPRSWTWGISKHCKNVRGAMTFLEYLLRPEEVLAISRANGDVPARRAAIAKANTYSDGGPLHILAQQLINDSSTPLKTPRYGILSTELQKALSRILAGDDVQRTLDAAATAIDRRSVEQVQARPH